MPDISVIGPMYDLQDLRTALNLLAGPNPIAARGYRNMPDLGLRKLSDLRIGIWRTQRIFR